MTAIGATAPRARPFATWPAWVIDLAICLASGLVAVKLGQSVAWDLQNYHLYDVWAWVHGRLDRDIAPANVQSYFNPLLHVPLYFLAEVLPAYGVTFAFGAVQGLNAVLLRRIAARALPAAQRGLGWLVALAGVTGAIAVGELGATQGDTLVSIPALAALLVALRVRDAAASPTPAAFFVGALLGVAAGLKLTMVPTAFGFALAATMLARGWQARWLAPALAGGVIGVIAGAGPWAWVSWTHWHDPLYPWLSTPPFGIALTDQSLRDGRWPPRDLVEAVTYPWRWLVDPFRVSELRFRDFRIALACTLMLWPGWWTSRDLATRGVAAAGVVAIVATLATWLALSGYYRYLGAIEMLAPLVITLMLIATMTRRSPRTVRIVATTVLVLLTISADPANWGRQRHTPRFVEVTWPARASVADPLLVLSGGEPLGFLVTAFPGAPDALRIDSNFHGVPRAPISTDRRVAERLDAHRGALLLLFGGADATARRDAARAVGLAVDPTRCDRVETNLRQRLEPPIWLCTVTRVESAIAALARR